MKALFDNIKKIAITTGDPNGIGLEVAAKALSQTSLSLRKHRACFFLFRCASQEKSASKYFKLIDKKYSRFIFNSADEALSFLNCIDSLKQLPDNLLIDLSLKTSPAEWVVETAKLCKNNKLTSMVTGPLSKTNTASLGKKPLGHTGIFRLMFPKSNFHMAFVGKNFNVLLATDHIPLMDIEKKLIGGSFNSALASAKKFKRLIGSSKKIAVLGLNPHSGEGGLIGESEKKLFKNFNHQDFDGPLVPDAAFLKNNWNRYCVFVSLYHDQGLIAFKSQHGQDSGVHITMGLPFVRTSVDHGTATDIFNKNIANPASMYDAIIYNLKLIGVRYV